MNLCCCFVVNLAVSVVMSDPNQCQIQCCYTVYAAGPKQKQHWIIASRLMGWPKTKIMILSQFIAPGSVIRQINQ